MPAKYHIPVRRVRPRSPSLGTSTVIDWGEGCLRCARCVKETCPVGAFRQRQFDPEHLIDTIGEFCRHCYRCVQGCPRELVFQAVNPQYEELGDEYWTPEIITSIWSQAESGKIPVSGAGYGGPFTGPGFDSFWTDMSEIVRPTRDGIHGREYISTAVDLGRKPLFLTFDSQGECALTSPLNLELPLPVLLAEPTLGAGPEPVRQALAQAARILNTLVLLPRENITPELEKFAPYLAPQYSAGAVNLKDPLLSRLRALELYYHPEVLAQVDALKGRHPELVILIRVPADEHAVSRVAQLAWAGAEIIHLAASEQAQGLGAQEKVHLKDLIRQCHLRLVEDQLRDSVTLLAGGGVAMAEHIPKAIICGADAIVVDIPLLLSLECRLCRQCLNGGTCPVEMEGLNPKRGAQRMVNLIGAWNNQLLEVLGAMGMREVRRLRGEVGRAMFVEDLEKEIFAPLFAPRAQEALRREGE